jgi:hypothetical protein
MDAVRACYKMLPQHLLEVNKENHENLSFRAEMWNLWSELSNTEA